jgi:IS30 family transposase
MHEEHELSVRRLARAFSEPPSTVERWLKRKEPTVSKTRRRRPVSDEPTLREQIRALADQPRHRTFGY